MQVFLLILLWEPTEITKANQTSLENAKFSENPLSGVLVFRCRVGKPEICSIEFGKLSHVVCYLDYLE